MTVMRKWSILTAVVVVAVLAAGWFLLVSPKRGDAAGLRDQAAQEQSKSAALQTQIAMLKAQAQNLPSLAAQLATMRVQLPSDPQLPKLVRDLSGAAKSSGVTLASLTPSEPVAVGSVIPTAPPSQPAGTTSGSTTGTNTGATTGTSTGATTGATAAAGSVAAAPTAPSANAATLFQVPIVIKVTGSYYELEEFLHQVEGFKRAFLTTGVDISANQSAGGTSGTSGSASTGELTMSLTGRVFVVPPAATVTNPQAVTPAPAK